MNELRHASFFSGVGGLDLGFENAGIRTVSQCEFDPYASAVLRERFPGVPNLGDITKINEKEIPNAEIYSGGFPCQDLSKAGARRGFTGGTRSSLAFTFLDLVERRRPRWFVLENVPGFFSSNDGRDFGRLIGEVDALGYGLAWRTLDAQWFGVPQRRRRVFIVAARDDDFGGVGGDRAAEVLIECEGECGHIGAGDEEGSRFTGRLGGSFIGDRRGAGMQRPSSEANANRERTAHGLARRLDHREGLELSDKISEAHTTTQKCFRKSARVNAPGSPETWVDDGVANTINAFDVGDIRSTHIVLGASLVGEEAVDSVPDSNRFRCIGNGVVSPVAEFIGRRIVAVDAKYWKEANV
jgi:DNA (cytosine-5)-methyltransferase 1